MTASRRLTALLAALWFAVIVLPGAAAAEDRRHRRPPPRPAKVKRERNTFGGELVIRGGPMFSVVRSAEDQLAPRGPEPAVYSLAMAIEGHAVLRERLSLWVQLGYALRREEWDSPDPDLGVPDLPLVTSRVHLLHFGVRIRPFFKRVTPYLVLGLGPDLVVQEPHYGGVAVPVRLFGLGVQAGGGLDVFLGPKAGLQLDVRNVVTLHDGTREVAFYHDEPIGNGHYERTQAYSIGFGPFEDTVELSLGLLLRF